MLLKMERFDELDQFVDELTKYSQKVSESNYRLKIFLL